jgi:L-aspartate semialdehyde sulfurtransferase
VSEVRKSFAEINERILAGKAVVLTAEEMKALVEEVGTYKAARQVDVVTTGTFGVMCSSGAVINFGHTRPRIRASRVWLNDVPAYGGLAAVDCYLGATELREDDPANTVHPGSFPYGGGHVIEDLVAGKAVRLRATGYGTDCYPNKRIEKDVTLAELPHAALFNPRNCYQNYNVAVNLSDRTIYTYMGVLKPEGANATFSSAGELSPLLNDPYYRTIGVGTKIFLGGGPGAVVWAGTQHSPGVERGENGVPRGGAGTLAVMGDLKGMKPRYLRGASLLGYGASLFVGVGVPIPILDEEMARFTSVRDRDIVAKVVDYSADYPQLTGKTLGEVNYGELRAGRITFRGRRIPATPLSSFPMAREICEELKGWVKKGRFTVGEPQIKVPGAR